jgi:hypothetical protein
MGWITVASGYLGEAVWLREELEVFKRAKTLLCNLEEYGEDKFDWNELLEGLPYFEPLRDLHFPPTYQETDFEFLDGFFTLTNDQEVDEEDEEAEVDELLHSYSSVVVEVNEEKLPEILPYFRTLVDRLETLIYKLEDESFALAKKELLNPPGDSKLLCTIRTDDEEDTEDGEYFLEKVESPNQGADETVFRLWSRGWLQWNSKEMTFSRNTDERTAGIQLVKLRLGSWPCFESGSTAGEILTVEDLETIKAELPRGSNPYQRRRD